VLFIVVCCNVFIIVRCVFCYREKEREIYKTDIDRERERAMTARKREGDEEIRKKEKINSVVIAKKERKC
jgi:hypothetical protein